ncbi:hypothetical protein ABH935_006048 [Catenulispora sp. GAS73]|uniref:hypothetical protein n=1 Tax=Catenulispora sp. GAS73 TaxID=3156269 RepID=UPI0035134EA4
MSLAALGMDGVPALDPLSYPGRTIDGPALLSGSQLFEMAPTAQRYLGNWLVAGGATLDDTLDETGGSSTGKRHPVIAIGSNAAPGQLHYKLSRLGRAAVVPMTTLRVSGLGVGVSAHVARNGYVANSPFADPGSEAEVVLTLLDADQLQAVDDTELPPYRRVLLSGADFPMTLPSGERLVAAYLYVNATGVLAGADGKPRLPSAQTALLSDLLERSARLRRLFDSPQDWVTKARADAGLRDAVKQIFHESGWVLPQDALLRNVYEGSTPSAFAYDEISPLASSRDRT